jgi:transcriptional regulator with XRE-family HTH domain
LAIIIGKNVKVLREKAKLTQEQLADYLGVDQNFVSFCENGERNFSTETIEKVSELFGCPSNLLLQEEILTDTFDFAFHTLDGQQMDLKTIVAINRITLNLLEMQRLRAVGEKFQSEHISI